MDKFPIIKCQLSQNVINSLPALSGSPVHYDRSEEMFITTSWISSYGYRYFKGILVSDRIVIIMALSDGEIRRFIDTIHVYRFNGNRCQLIGSKSYPKSYYSREFVKRESASVLSDFLKSQIRVAGGYCSDDEIERQSRCVIDEVCQITKSVA